MQPVVSLIVPIYNIEERLLRRGIESLLHQTMQPIEVLLIDDGSPDHAGDICDEYAETDVRVRVFHNENGGVSVARNCGIKNSNGKYIIFIDPDDYVPQNMCEECVNAIEKAKTDVLIFGYSQGRESNKNRSKEIEIIKDTDKAKIEQSIISQKPIKSGFIVGSPWGKIFDGEYIREQLRFVPGLKRSQDRVFMLYAIEKANKLAWFDYTGYYYELTTESCGKKYNPNIVSILEKAGKEMEKFVLEYHSDESSFQMALNQMWIAFSFDYMQLYFCNKQFDGNSRYEIKKLFDSDPYKRAIKMVNLKNFRKKIEIVYTLYRMKMYGAGSTLCKIFNNTPK